MTLPPFQTLLDAHALEVHRFLTGILGREHADDCYQETWLSALRAYPQLRHGSNLRSWVFTIAHRKALDHLRTRRETVGMDAVPEPAAPEHAVADHELWAQVLELPEKQRTAVALRYVLDAPYAEISEVMGTSEEAARRNVHEGLKRLRRDYQP